MKYYLKDVLSRLQKQSATLDQSAFLVDKPWVVSNSEEAFEKLIFKRDGSLYLSSNGDVTVGKWEYLPEAQSLLIDYGDKKKLYRHQFLDESVLALKIDGPDLGDENYYLLANENEVPDYDAKKYLVNKVKQPKQLNSQSTSKEVQTIIDKYQKHKSGRYISPDGTEMVKITNGKVENKYKSNQYPEGVIIWQSGSFPNNGDVVESKIPKSKLKVRDDDNMAYSLKVNQNGIITDSAPAMLYVFGILAIGIIILIILMAFLIS